MNSPKVLIVEDEGIIALDLEHQLSSIGYVVTGTAASGNLAIELAQQDKPDVVLMDIRLQGEMDGVDAARVISLKFGVPVVYLTSYTDDDTFNRAKETEPHGYLVKPFDLRELKTTIELALHRHQMDLERREMVSDVIMELTKEKEA